MKKKAKEISPATLKREITPGVLCRFPEGCVAIWGNPPKDYHLPKDEIFLFLSSEELVKEKYYEFYFLDSQGIKIMVPDHRDFSCWVELGFVEILT